MDSWTLFATIVTRDKEPSNS